MSKPRLLDLFCGAGGCAVGYAQAGFEVVGVDIAPQPHYPYEFHQADALTFLLDGFDVIHASPPCQHYTLMLNWNAQAKENHPDLVALTREKLKASGLPYVIENVVGSPLEKAIMLCGAMFNLQVYRHRHFESNTFLFQPNHPRHTAKTAHTGMIPKSGEFYSPAGHLAGKHGSQRAMGIDWMLDVKEIANAIPPAYTAWIGAQLLDAIRQNGEVSA